MYSSDNGSVFHLLRHTIPRHIPGMYPGAMRWNVLVLLSYLFTFVLLVDVAIAHGGGGFEKQLNWL